MSTPLKKRAVRAIVTPAKASRGSRTATGVIAKTVRGMAETKYTSGEGPFLISGLANIWSSRNPLTFIATGATKSERIGNSIQVQSIDLLIHGYNTGAIRVAVVSPKDPSVSWDANLRINTVLDPKSYWVLYDRIHDCQGSMPSTLGADTLYGPAINIKLNRRVNVDYYDTAGNAYSRNPLFLVVFPGHKAWTTANEPGLITGHWRVWYKDY